MNHKTLRVVGSIGTAVACVAIVFAAIKVSSSVGKDNGASYDGVAQTYVLKYENALKEHALSQSLSATSSVEPTVGTSQEPDADATLSPVVTETPAGDDNQQHEGNSNTEPGKGDSGSSENSTDVDDHDTDAPSVGSDEADNIPESGTLPNYSSICVKDNDGNWVYIVKRGDTLSKVSGMVGYSVQELASYNHIRNIHRIYVGQSIRIPHE